MKRTIYKTDSKGRLRYIAYSTDGDILVQESGLVDTDSPTVNRKQCHPKNIGKSNETSGEQQAELELEAKVTKKLKTEYFETIQEAQNQKVILPMLAKKYKDEKHKIGNFIDENNHIYIQPKLDGYRCMAVIEHGGVTLWSRSNREITTMDHIREQLEYLPDGIYDGELYTHGLTFQQISKRIKKDRGDSTKLIQYHMYDMLLDLPFKVRMETLAANYERGFKRAYEESVDMGNLILVPTTRIRQEFIVKQMHDTYVEEGYEGMMVRWGDYPYKTNGRSDSLLKFKIMEDLTLVIIDIEPNEADPTQGTPIVKLDNGTLVRCNVKGSHEERRELLSNKQNYIGLKAEIRFFGYTDDGSLRHPTYYGIRDDK